MNLRTIGISLFSLFAWAGTTVAQDSQPAAPEDKSESKPAAEAASKDPRVELTTSMGKIVLELNPTKAPITTKNFLSYVNDGFYDGTIFHRVIGNFMIQGGGFEQGDGVATQKKTKAPIKNEGKNGLKNVVGTISMARLGDPDSATTQFFINVVNNPTLDPKDDSNPNGFTPDGYAVFGKVVEGMEVVNKIRQVDTGLKRFKARHPATGQLIETRFKDAPLQPVVIESAKVLK